MADSSPSKSDHSNEKLDIKYKVPTDHKEVYLPEFHSGFITRIQQIYSNAIKAVKGRNAPKWAKCCKVMLKKGNSGALGHPKADCESFKRIFEVNNIQSQKEFINFMSSTVSVQ